MSNLEPEFGRGCSREEQGTQETIVSELLPLLLQGQPGLPGPPGLPVSITWQPFVGRGYLKKEP